MIRLVLRLFDLLSPVITVMGADYPQFRAILEVKLTLDTRRAMTAAGAQNRKKSANAFVAGLVMYLFMGIFIAFLPMTAGSPLVSMTIIHAFVMTMLGLSLVADFSSVLLDTTDNMILQPRPVIGRTILVARIAHIVVYLGSLTLALSTAAMIAGTFKWGWAFPPVFIATLGCSVILVVFLVTLFYLAAMRFTSGERLRDVILYVQVFMSVLVVGGYQLVPRLIDMTALKDLRIDDRAWVYFCPPAWMAAPVDLLAGHVGPVQLTLTLLGVGVPAVGLLVSMRFLSSSFGAGLARIDAPATRPAPSTRSSAGSLGLWLGRTLYRNPVGQAVFELVWRLCARDRQFKQRTYSALSFLAIFPVIWLFSGNSGVRFSLADIRASHKYLLVLYMVCAMLPSVLVHLRFSDNWAAGWIYTALPVPRPGQVFAAALGAVAIRFIVPVFVIASGVILAIWGPAVLDDIALAACGAFLMCGFHGVAFGRHFPFSQAFATTDASGRFARNFFLLLIPAILGGGHFLLTLVPALILPACLPVLLVGGLLFRAVGRTGWDALD